MTIEVFCNGCGERGEIPHLAAKVVHDGCGSADVDLWMGSPEQIQRAAALAGPPPVFADFMRVAKQPGMPPPSGDTDRRGYVGDDPVAGWDEYQGPGPHPNPMAAPSHTEISGRAPTKKQPGAVEESNLYVYDKHHPDPGYGEDVPEPLVAKHEYPAPYVTKTPFLGRRKRERSTTVPGIALEGAACPRCGAADTAIVTDDRDHAHWYCGMRLCGSLADLDLRPNVDPYRPARSEVAWGIDEFWHGRKVASGAKNGQIMRRIATIGRVNPGLSLSEVVSLARQSVIEYPEA